MSASRQQAFPETSTCEAKADGRPSFVCRWLYPAALLVQLVLYLLTLAPGVSRGDSGEIATAVVRLGVIHPTGYPLFTVVGHLFTRLPIPVDPIVKIEIMNALFAVGATLFAALAVRTLALRLQGHMPAPDPVLARAWPLRPRADQPGRPAARRRIRLWPFRRRTREGGKGTPATKHAKDPSPAGPRDAWEADLAGLFAGLLLGLSTALWERSRIAEVYTLHIFFVAWALYYWTRFEVTRRDRYILFAAVPMGLAGAHHVTIVYLFPGAFVYVLIRRPFLFVSWLLYPLTRLVRLFRPRFMERTIFARWWLFPVCCVIGALPLLTYSYFLWATAHTDALPWGGVHDWNSLKYHATGRQYRNYVKGWSHDKLWPRIKGLPGWLDTQFLLAALLPGIVGALVLLRRAWPFVLLLLLFVAGNTYHGAQYAPGNYRDYFVPSLCAVLIAIGIGTWWVTRRIGRRAPHEHPLVFGSVVAVVMAVIGGCFLYYGRFESGRLPLELRKVGRTTWAIWVVCGMVLLSLLVPIVIAKLRSRGGGLARLRGLSLVVLALAFLGLASVVPSRLGEMWKKGANAEDYIAGVIHAVTPGSLFLNGGDSYSFPVWYAQHVRGLGRDMATINVHMYGNRWYRKYLEERHPIECDVMAPELYEDLGLWEERCGTYRKRLDAFDKTAWLKMRLGGGRSSNTRNREPPLDERILDVHDRCHEHDYRRTHKDDCYCWDYNEKKRPWDDECVFSKEANAVVHRTQREINAHALLADHIDERDVFERNLFTRWEGRDKNDRKWSGPAYQRLSAQYSLLNRGQINQVVYHADIDGVDPCANDTLERIALREYEEVQKRPLPPRRRPRYEETDRPVLIEHSELGTKPRSGPTEQKFSFGPEEPIRLSIFWFERFRYDPDGRNRHGDPIRHGVRICFFGPEGQRVLTRSVVTSGKSSNVKLPVEQRAGPGIYTVQACTVGDLGTDAKGRRRTSSVPEDLPCKYPVLEYDFEIVQ